LKQQFWLFGMDWFKEMGRDRLCLLK